MNELDRTFLMGRTAAPGSSMERLIDMAYAGNVAGAMPMPEPVRGEEDSR